MTINLIFRAIFFILLIIPIAVKATSPYSLTGSASLNSDNNLSFGSYSRDIVSDDFFDLSLDLKHTNDINKNNRIILSTSASFKNYSKYSGLNSNTLDFKANYQFQFSNSFRSPIYAMYLNIGQSDFDSDLRDNIHTDIGLTISWRYDDRTLLRGGYISSNTDADATSDGLGNTYQTFDNQRNTVFLSINIKPSDTLSLYSSVSLISGDITANWTSQTLDDYAITFTNIRESWETIPDEIFGSNWESTKYNADITKWTLGFNYAIGQRNALDIALESLDADSGIYSYKIERISLSYLHKF